MKVTPASFTIFRSIFLFREDIFYFLACFIIAFFVLYFQVRFSTETTLLEKHLRKISELVLRSKYSSIFLFCLLILAVGSTILPSKAGNIRFLIFQ